MKGMPLLSLLVKMNHFSVWQLSEKRLTVNIAFFFLPFILFLHLQAVVAMKNKWHFLKWYPQRPSPYSTEPANLGADLGTLFRSVIQALGKIGWG